MSWTFQALSWVVSWKNEENIVLEVEGVLQNCPIDFNVKFSEKLKSCSTLKLNNWKLEEAIKKTTGNFEGLNVLKRWEVEWLKKVENWRRRYISKVMSVSTSPIDSNVKKIAEKVEYF